MATNSIDCIVVYHSKTLERYNESPPARKTRNNEMVELSSATDPFQHGFPNIVFVIPAVVVIGLSVFFGYKLYLSLTEKDRKREEKMKAKQSKKKK